MLLLLFPRLGDGGLLHDGSMHKPKGFPVMSQLLLTRVPISDCDFQVKYYNGFTHAPLCKTHQFTLHVENVKNHHGFFASQCPEFPHLKYCVNVEGVCVGVQFKKYLLLQTWKDTVPSIKFLKSSFHLWSIALFVKVERWKWNGRDDTWLFCNM